MSDANFEGDSNYPPLLVGKISAVTKLGDALPFGLPLPRFVPAFSRGSRH
jgi:hypothetical protein